MTAPLHSMLDSGPINEPASKLLLALNNRITLSTTAQLLFGEFRLLDRLSELTASKHPQGFITFKLGITEDSKEALRLHIWLPDKRDLADQPGFEIHNHTFGFTSLLLTGKMTNSRYQVVESASDTGQRLFSVSYSGPNKDTIVPEQIPINIIQSGVDELTTGQHYSIQAGEFHKSFVPIDTLTITLLATSAGAAISNPHMVGPATATSPITTLRQKPTGEELALVRDHLSLVAAKLLDPDSLENLSF